MRGKIPASLIDNKPTTQSVKFCGQYINLTAVADASGVTQSHVSRIFAGRRNPSVASATKLAGVMKMTLEDLLQGIKERVA